MATYTSRNYKLGGRSRPTGEDNANELTTTITIPAGVALASGDVLKFGRLGENVRITQFELEMDQFDSNASAALAGDLGITADPDCMLDGVVLQTNTTGKKNIARVDGEATAIDSFAATPFPVQTTVQEILLTLTASPGTAFNTGNRNITLRFVYQYIYPDVYAVGVDNTQFPFVGSKVFNPAIIETYNGNAP